MCEKQDLNENQPKLTADEFFNQLRDLLAKAPEHIVYVVNAVEHPENKLFERHTEIEEKALIAVSGSNSKLAFAFNVAFDQNPHFEAILNHVIDYNNFTKSKKLSPFPMRTDFPSKESIERLFDRIMKR